MIEPVDNTPDGGNDSLYRFFSEDGRLLYVGITANPGRRLGQHRADKDWWGDVAGITVQRFSTRETVRAAEALAIRVENPLHNIQRPGKLRVDRPPKAARKYRTQGLRPGDRIWTGPADQDPKRIAVVSVDVAPPIIGNPGRAISALASAGILHVMATTGCDKQFFGTCYRGEIDYGISYGQVYCCLAQLARAVSAIEDAYHGETDAAWQLAGEWWDEIPAILDRTGHLDRSWFDRQLDSREEPRGWFYGVWPLADIEMPEGFDVTRAGKWALTGRSSAGSAGMGNAPVAAGPDSKREVKRQEEVDWRREAVTWGDDTLEWAEASLPLARESLLTTTTREPGHP